LNIMKTINQLFCTAAILGAASIVAPGLTRSASAQTATGTITFGNTTVAPVCTFIGTANTINGDFLYARTDALVDLDPGRAVQLLAAGAIEFGCNSETVGVDTTLTSLTVPTDTVAGGDGIDDPLHSVIIDALTNTNGGGGGANIQSIFGLAAFAQGQSNNVTGVATDDQGDIGVGIRSIFTPEGEELSEGTYGATFDVVVTAEASP
jgi:hypothetical protein